MMPAGLGRRKSICGRCSTQQLNAGASFKACMRRSHAMKPARLSTSGFMVTRTHVASGKWPLCRRDRSRRRSSLRLAERCSIFFCRGRLSAGDHRRNRRRQGADDSLDANPRRYARPRDWTPGSPYRRLLRLGTGFEAIYSPSTQGAHRSHASRASGSDRHSANARRTLD